MKAVAWTGGSAPANPPTWERLQLAKKLYRQQCGIYTQFWGEKVPESLKETYWTHAVYDAHATLRDYHEKFHHPRG